MESDDTRAFGHRDIIDATEKIIRVLVGRMIASLGANIGPAPGNLYFLVVHLDKIQNAV